MDIFAGAGDILWKMVFLQAAAAVLVVFLLKKYLERELFMGALEKIARMKDPAIPVEDVVVVCAAKLSGDDEFRLRSLLKDRFPLAEVTLGENAALGGGVVVRAGEEVLDFSLAAKLKLLFNRS